MIVPPKALAKAHQVMPVPSATAINHTVAFFLPVLANRMRWPSDIA